MEQMPVPPKYTPGMYFKCWISNTIIVIERVRWCVFKGNGYHLYIVKEFDKGQYAYHNSWTENQLEGLYEPCPAAQILLGDT